MLFRSRCALIHDSPVTGTVRRFSYAELQREVARLAGVLVSLGVQTGDRVLVYMPMVPEAVMAMLACARIGAIHSVVFGGFAAHELAVRIDDATPVVVLTASCGIEPARVVAYKPLLDAAIGMATHQPRHCVVLQRPQLVADMHSGRDIDWSEAIAAATPAAYVPVIATHPLYILYTSGTTGQPKGVMHSFGHISDAAEGIVRAIRITPEERVLSYLPLAHVFERAYIESASLVGGGHVFFAESLETFVADLQRARPTLFISVPRLWLKFQQGVFKKMPPERLDLLLKFPIIRGLVARKVLKGLGLDSVRLAGSGSAPIPAELIAW